MLVKAPCLTRAINMFQLLRKRGLYYLYNENQGADQPCCYRTGDLRLCFRLCNNRFSHDTVHILFESNLQREQKWLRFHFIINVHKVLHKVV